MGNKSINVSNKILIILHDLLSLQIRHGIGPIGSISMKPGYVKTASTQKIHLHDHLVLLTDFASHSLMI